MISTKNKVLVGVGTATLLAGLLASTAAGAASHNLNIKNVGDEPFRVCEHWSPPDRILSTTSRDCQPGAIRLLYPGQTTRGAFGWADADAVVVDADEQMKEDKIGPNPVIVNFSDVTQYRKVSPDIDGYRKFYSKDR